MKKQPDMANGQYIERLINDEKAYAPDFIESIRLNKISIKCPKCANVFIWAPSASQYCRCNNCFKKFTWNDHMAEEEEGN